MKILQLFLIAFIMSSPIFAESAPKWLLSPEKEFPSDSFIRAVGTGPTEKKARTDALSAIALCFKTKTKVVNTAIQHLELITENDNSNQSQTQMLHQEIEIISDTDLYCVQFTDAFYDKKQKEYSIIGYINKSEASKLLKTKINTLISQIKSLQNVSTNETELLYIILNYQRAKIYGEIAKNYIDIAITRDCEVLSVNSVGCGKKF